MSEWINNFTANKIPFYTYKMIANDCLIYTDNNQVKKTIIILYGIILILKVFTNGESICIAILSKNNLINLDSCKKYNKRYYFQAIAIEESWVLSFQSNYIYKTSPKNINMFFKAYNITMKQQAVMNEILIHRETKFRLIQLIIYLSEEFGYIQKQYITFNFRIYQTTLALIIGSNKFTINKIVKKLYNQLIIKMYKKKFLYILINKSINDNKFNK